LEMDNGPVDGEVPRAELDVVNFGAGEIVHVNQ
jgi:hypothetical protein